MKAARVPSLNRHGSLRPQMLDCLDKSLDEWPDIVGNDAEVTEVIDFVRFRHLWRRDRNVGVFLGSPQNLCATVADIGCRGASRSVADCGELHCPRIRKPSSGIRRNDSGQSTRRAGVLLPLGLYHRNADEDDIFWRRFCTGRLSQRR